VDDATVAAFRKHGHAAVEIHGIGSPLLSFVYCAPHTFDQGNDAPASSSTPASR
jgi:hypothetical protein